MGYREPGVVPRGTFEGPLTDAGVSLGKMGVLLADRLDPWGPQRYIYSHMCMEEQWPGSDKVNRVLLPKRAQEWKLWRAQCHQTQHTPPTNISSISDRDGPMGPRGFSSYSTSYLDIGIPAFL